MIIHISNMKIYAEKIEVDNSFWTVLNYCNFDGNILVDLFRFVKRECISTYQLFFFLFDLIISP